MENDLENYYPDAGKGGEPASAPAAKTKPEKIKGFALSSRDSVFAGIMTVLTVLFSLFGLGGNINLGFCVVFDLMFIACSVYLAEKKNSPGIFGTVCGVLSLALSWVFFFSSGFAVRALSLLALFCTSAVWFYSLAGRREGKNELGLIGAILANSFGVIFPSVVPSLKGLASENTGEGQKKTSKGKIFLGIAAALPVAAVCVYLLTSADDAFDGLIGFTMGDVLNRIPEMIFGLILAPFVIAFCFGLKKTAPRGGKEASDRGLDAAFTASFLSVLAVCYLAYLFSQLAYFFTAFKGILPENYTFTYAEYARRGFFELCGIAAINFAVLYLVLLTAKKNEGKLPAVLRALGTFIAVFTLLIIATALSKMIMYISRYGMTFDRISTSAFMIFLAVVFIALIIRFFTARMPVLRVALVTASLVLCIMGIGNTERFVADYNLKLFTEQKGIVSQDVEYFSQLGPEGTEAIIHYAEENDWAEDILATHCNRNLYYIYEGDYVVGKGNTYFTERIHPDGIADKNLAYERAYNAMDKYIEEHPEFLEKAFCCDYFFGWER